MKTPKPAIAPILTVTLNPALDIATSVARMEPGIKLRCAEPRIDPGGGGINVARVIRRLGGRCTALAVVGGAAGGRLMSLLDTEEIPAVAIQIPAETRQSFVVTDESNGAQFRFILPGPIISSDCGTTLRARIADAAAAMESGGLAVFSGSFPPGIPAGFVADCAALLRPTGHRVCVDTSGAVLQDLVSHPGDHLFLLRLDQSEAMQVSGHRLAKAVDSADFAAELVRHGVAKFVVVGCGAEGSVLATGGARYFCASAKVPVVSTTGAGDSFMGALTLSLARGEPPDQALRWGVAAASAAVMTPATHLCDAAMVHQLLGQCPVSAI